jgi:hypothetical protein
MKILMDKNDDKWHSSQEMKLDLGSWQASKEKRKSRGA